MAENDFDYLNAGIQQQDGVVLKNLSQMGETLKELKVAMETAKATAEQATKAYEHYANVVIPQQMFSAGIDSIGLSSGGSLIVKRNFYCQPNKNAEDKAIIAKWLRENGGEHLIKHDATVSAVDFNKLQESGVPYIENTSVNSQSLKAFLKDKIGATTGIQQISIDDIPACVHFQEVTTVELEV